MTPADLHVHTEWSWDAARGSMEESCRRALELGLPAIAFTDHADFNPYPSPEWHPPDMAGYHDCVERCRAAFPALRILSGVELGEPHLFPEQTAAVLGAGPLDRVLGSVHCIAWDGSLTDASVEGTLTVSDAAAKFRAYLGETLRLVETDVPFSALAHLDYPKRYWPRGAEYREQDFEDELRAVLRALAARGSALELNTTRGGEPGRYLCPGPAVLSWWHEEGGRAVCFGSDAHSPDKIAEGFRLAAGLAEAAGFRPNDDPTSNWLR